MSDELLRYLERQISLGDEKAHCQLHQERIRLGLPVFNHDCDACIFLGTIKIDRDSKESCFPFYLDLYVCASPDPERSDSRAIFGPTLLVRYSDEGFRYASQNRSILHSIRNDFAQRNQELGDMTKVLLEADRRATLLGII